MSNEDPIAFFFTWTTYGTWLPGDERGWVEYQKGFRLPDPARELEAAARLSADACWLDPEQREQVNSQVAETCGHKRWLLQAVNCRSNHVHVVTSASAAPKTMRGQLKAWSSRRLNDHQRKKSVDMEALREIWWADRGSIRWIFDTASLEAATLYVRDEQDDPRRFTAR